MQLSSKILYSVRFGFFRTKIGSNRFGSVFSVLGSFFSVWLNFFRFGFGFFGFSFIKQKPNRTGRFFFKILIGFFSRFGFFNYFSSFLNLINFSVFFLPLPNCYQNIFCLKLGQAAIDGICRGSVR